MLFHKIQIHVETRVPFLWVFLPDDGKFAKHPFFNNQLQTDHLSTHLPLAILFYDFRINIVHINSVIVLLLLSLFIINLYY